MERARFKRSDALVAQLVSTVYAWKEFHVDKEDAHQILYDWLHTDLVEAGYRIEEKNTYGSD